MGQRPNSAEMIGISPTTQLIHLSIMKPVSFWM